MWLQRPSTIIFPIIRALFIGTNQISIIYFIWIMNSKYTHIKHYTVYTIQNKGTDQRGMRNEKKKSQSHGKGGVATTLLIDHWFGSCSKTVIY